MSGSASQTGPLALTKLQAPSHLNSTLSRFLQASPTLFRSNMAGPTDVEPRGLDIRLRAPNRHPLVHFGLRAPQLLNSPLSRIFQASPTLFKSNMSGPTDVEPRGLDIRLRAPNRHPLAHFGLRAPQVLNSPLSCIFQASPTLFRSNMAGPTNIEPRGLDIRLRAPNCHPLVRFGLRAPQLLNSPLSRIFQAFPILFRSNMSGPTDVEPRGLDIRLRAPNRHPLVRFGL
jgi:S-ribosylhomocysteine lyase LuxS involved in autoinducer biosynthesis